jgi:hypothetical protein
MLSAGTVSAFVGFKMGTEALKGVSQPDVNPTKKLTSKQPNKPQVKKVAILSEKEILNRVKSYINSKNKKTGNSSDKKALKDNKKDSKETKENKSTKETKSIIKKDEKQGVNLEVVKTSKDDGALVLDVNLKNKSSKSVRFLYSFIEIKDDKGRDLSSITEGLPDELPANSTNYSGTIKIPIALLDDAKKISLNLSDYPDRQIELNIKDIPIN